MKSPDHTSLVSARSVGTSTTEPSTPLAFDSMDRLLIALGIAVAAGAIAMVMRRRRPDAPTQSNTWIPEQLDRADFDQPATPWLVAVFTSATCDACRDVRAKADVLAVDHTVAVSVAEHPERRDLHQRYRIDAVPLVVIADGRGVVHRSFLGPVSATDLWAAVAAVREADVS